MTTLTKSGIRELMAKYRSILKKCAILNAMVLAFGASSAMAVAPSAYTLTEVGETENYNYYDIVNGTKTYYQITPKSGTHYEIGTEGTTNFSIKSIKTGSDSYHVTPQGTSADRVGDFNATIGSEGSPVVFYGISTNPTHPDKGGAVYNYDNAEEYSIYADFVSNTTTNYGGGVRNGYHSSAFIDKIVGDFVNNSAGDVGGAIANAPDCDSALGENPSINEITGNFIGNSANNGGAIYNERIIGKITGDFLSNKSNDKGGAISNINIGTIGNTADSTSGIFGNFVSNSSINGGAIYNEGTISNIKGDFILNTATTSGGAIYNSGSAVINNIKGSFNNNSAVTGGAIYNAVRGSITDITGNFTANTASGNGGAIYNDMLGSITDITGNFTANTAGASGGAIYNAKRSLIGNVTGNFTENTASANGGAIYNGGTITCITGVDDGTGNKIAFYRNSANGSGGAIANGQVINKIVGDFIENSAGSYGGAIYSFNSIGNITGNFTSNTATVDGGAIHNSNSIGNITGNFTSNTAGANGGAIYSFYSINDITGNFTANSAGANGGAIYNKTRIAKVTGNFTNNFAETNGGAVYNSDIIAIETASDHNNIEFSGNYVTVEDGGGAIYNGGTVGLYAVNTGDKIEFTGKIPTTIPTDVTPQDVDGICNEATLNINGFENDTHEITSYAGTVDLQNVSGTGTTNIYGGTVHFGGNYTQGATNIYGGTLNFANNKINTANLGVLNLVGNANLMLDADLAGEGKMDQLKVTSVSGDGNIVISDIKLLSDAIKDEVSLSLFAEGTPSSVYDKVSGNLNGLHYSSIYTYDANYDKTEGEITFTRHKSGSSDDFNPYLYAPSTMAQTTANITGQIAGLAMDKLDVAVTDSEKGLAGGDLPKANNAWVKVMGFDDNVDFKGFNNTLDSKAYTLTGGFNTDKVKFDNFDAAFGIYAGYIGGRQKYTGSKLEQKGGYVGLSSELAKGNAFLLSTIDAGFINNEDENMYGTDKFDTRWFGIGLKGGYNYALTDAWTLQPNVYAGYTLVNTEDYTSKSGVRVNNDNLNFFEIDPGFKLMTQIDKNWLGFIQGKYAIVMDNGSKTTVNEIVLPNISAKNYVEYGIGVNKSLTDAWSLNGAINRRDGGRTGWNGSIEFKYNF